MKLGIDLGNYATKSEVGISFLSKVAFKPTIGAKDFITYENKEIYLGEGEFDTEYRKAYRSNIIYLLAGAIVKSTSDKNNKVVVGLPLSQYEEDKGYLTNRIMQSGLVDDVEVFPEGVVAAPKGYEGIVIDVGGRTTDICQLIYDGGKRRIINPKSIPIGMLNLESELIEDNNKAYGLDLKEIDAQRILNGGLYIYGEKKQIIMDSYKGFVEELVRKVQLDYSIKTNKLALVGGGSEILFKPIKKRLPQSLLVEDSFLANAKAFGKIAKEIFK